MKICVIGGAGYIGSHVVLAFLDQGHSVTVYDNLSKGRRENVVPKAEFVLGDILDLSLVESTFKRGFDGIVHLAALKAAGESMVKPDVYATNNITGTINILNAAIKNNIKYIVFSSSAAVYGEPQYVPIDEQHPTNPINFYGYTKLCIEQLLSWYNQTQGLHYSNLRYFNAAGYDSQLRCFGLETNPANLLPILMEVAVGVRKRVEIYGTDYSTKDGTGIRDYIHVSDLSKAHCLALEYISTQKKNLTVNLGNEHGISVLEMIEKTREICGRHIQTEIVKRRPGDPAVVLASSKYAHKELGWVPHYSDIDTLIKTTWAVYQKNYY